MLEKLALGLTLTLAAPTMALAQQRTVTCKDGATSEGGRGACSHHGGIDYSAPTKAPAAQAPARPAPVTRAPAAPAPATAAPPAPTARPPLAPLPRGPAAQPQAPMQPQQPAAPDHVTARCRDGSLSYSRHHSGACSHHGGVDQWMQQ